MTDLTYLQVQLLKLKLVTDLIGSWVKQQQGVLEQLVVTIGNQEEQQLQGVQLFGLVTH